MVTWNTKLTIKDHDKKLADISLVHRLMSATHCYTMIMSAILERFVIMCKIQIKIEGKLRVVGEEEIGDRKIGCTAFILSSS